LSLTLPVNGLAVIAIR